MSWSERYNTAFKEAEQQGITDPLERANRVVELSGCGDDWLCQFAFFFAAYQGKPHLREHEHIIPIERLPVIKEFLDVIKLPMHDINTQPIMRTAELFSEFGYYRQAIAVVDILNQIENEKVQPNFQKIASALDLKADALMAIKKPAAAFETRVIAKIISRKAGI